MLRKTTAAVLLTPLRSAASISKRKKEEADPLHLRPEKEEREEKEKAESLPVHPDQMPALQKVATGAPVPRERRLGNVAKSGKLQIPANGEASANSSTFPLASSMLRAIANQEVRVRFHTEMAPQIPKRTKNPQQDLLLDCRPSAYRKI